MAEKTGVLVVDDSAFMRKVISQIINDSERFYVVATARDGNDALKTLEEHKREVQLVTLDIQMPGMDGLTCLRNIMEKHPRRVIMVSSLTTDGARETLQALEYGAVDFIAKPGGAISLAFDQVGDQLLQILESATQCSMPKPGIIHRPPTKELHPAVVAVPEKFTAYKGSLLLIAVASSTGGPKALASLIPQIPKDIPAAILIVQHMPTTFTKLLADRLDRSCEIQVKEAEEGDQLKAGLCLIAPGGVHTEVTRDERIRLTKDPPIGGLRPCADVTFQTIASVFGNRSLGVVLTGMGRDGTAGCRALRNRGCKILVESKETALIYGMPKSVVENNLHDQTVPLDKMAAAIVERLNRDYS